MAPCLKLGSETDTSVNSGGWLLVTDFRPYGELASTMVAARSQLLSVGLPKQHRKIGINPAAPIMSVDPGNTRK
jgi:hypothetical protein